MHGKHLIKKLYLIDIEITNDHTENRRFVMMPTLATDIVIMPVTIKLASIRVLVFSVFNERCVDTGLDTALSPNRCQTK